MPRHDLDDLTAWISGDIHPVREGVYERRMSDGSFSCWNGRHWNRDAASVAEATAARAPSRDQRASWRGLVRQSSLPCATCKGHTVVDRGFDVERDTDMIAECPDC